MEGKIGLFKTILEQLNAEKTSTPPEQFLSRTCFFSNLFSGLPVLRSFELVRGYQSSILGLTHNIISQDQLQARKEQVAARALQKPIRSRGWNNTGHNILKKGDLIGIGIKCTKKSYRHDWINVVVEQRTPHYVQARKSKRERPMRIAYKDVRRKPQHKLRQELLSCSLEEELSDDSKDLDDADLTKSNMNHNDICTLMVITKQPKYDEKYI